MSDKTAAKITNKHHIEIQEIRDVVEYAIGLCFVMDDDPERGLRALVEVRIRRRRALIVLYPDAGLADAWHLGSAYFV